MLLPLTAQPAQQHPPGDISAQSLRRDTARQMGVASSELTLYKLQPVPLDSKTSAGEQFAVAVNQSSKAPSYVTDSTSSCTAEAAI